MALPLSMWCSPEQSKVPRRDLGPRLYKRRSVVSLGARWYQDVRRPNTASSAECSYPFLAALGNLLLWIHGKATLLPRLHYATPLLCFTLPFLVCGDDPPQTPTWAYHSLPCLNLSFLTYGNEQSYVRSLVIYFHCDVSHYLLDSGERLPRSH